MKSSFRRRFLSKAITWKFKLYNLDWQNLIQSTFPQVNKKSVDPTLILTLLQGWKCCWGGAEDDLWPVFPLSCACAVPPDHLCSAAISFSRTSNIPNITSYIHRIAFVTLDTLHWLCVYMVAQLHANKNKFVQRNIFLELTLVASQTIWRY